MDAAEANIRELKADILSPAGSPRRAWPNLIKPLLIAKNPTSQP
jgi:hypothetical protein